MSSSSRASPTCRRRMSHRPEAKGTVPASGTVPFPKRRGTVPLPRSIASGCTRLCQRLLPRRDRPVELQRADSREGSAHRRTGRHTCGNDVAAGDQGGRVDLVPWPGHLGRKVGGRHRISSTAGRPGPQQISQRRGLRMRDPGLEPRPRPALEPRLFSERHEPVKQPGRRLGLVVGEPQPSDNARQEPPVTRPAKGRQRS